MIGCFVASLKEWPICSAQLSMSHPTLVPSAASESCRAVRLCLSLQLILLIGESGRHHSEGTKGGTTDRTRKVTHRDGGDDGGEVMNVSDRDWSDFTSDDGCESGG